MRKNAMRTLTKSDYADSTANQLDISNSVIHGSITSMLPGGYYDRFDADGNNLGGYDFYTDADRKSVV